jgi:hypothetical protein
MHDDLYSHISDNNKHVVFGRAANGYYFLTIKDSILWFTKTKFERLDTDL